MLEFIINKKLYSLKINLGITVHLKFNKDFGLVKQISIKSIKNMNQIKKRIFSSLTIGNPAVPEVLAAMDKAEKKKIKILRQELAKNSTASRTKRKKLKKLKLKLKNRINRIIEQEEWAMLHDNVSWEQMYRMELHKIAFSI